jgi:hypothetical protein
MRTKVKFKKARKALLDYTKYIDIHSSGIDLHDRKIDGPKTNN